MGTIQVSSALGEVVDALVAQHTPIENPSCPIKATGS
jgi:hypothetical protein